MALEDNAITTWRIISARRLLNAYRKVSDLPDDIMSLQNRYDAAKSTIDNLESVLHMGEHLVKQRMGES
jgi:hypothetical protein